MRPKAKCAWTLGLGLSLGLAVPAGAAVTVSPGTVTVAQGGTSTPLQVLVSYVTNVPPAGTTGTLTFLNLPTGVTTVPTPVTYMFTGAPTAQTTFRLSVPATLKVGTYALTVSGAGTAGSTRLLLNVVPAAPPVIDRILPPTVAAGTIGTRLLLVGNGYAPGARATTTSTWLRIDSTRYLSPTQLEAFVSVLADAPAGPQAIGVTNPDGQGSQRNPPLIVLPTRSPSNAASLSTIVIATPRAGSALSSSERVFPKALLAVSGAGVVMGTWLVDGVPFDRFVLQTFGSQPIEVRARVAIPPLLDGEHSLQIEIDTPQRLRSEPITLIVTREAASALHLIAPRDSVVLALGVPPPTFRWSIVPGAFGYEVEIETGRMRRIYHAPDPEWTPDAETYAQLDPGDHRWRVRAIFVGGIRGEFTDARAFALGTRRSEAAPEPEPEVRWLFASQPVKASPRPAATPAPTPAATPTVASEPAAAAAETPAVDPYRREMAAATVQTGLTTMHVNDETSSIGMPPDSLRLQLSGRADLARREGYLRAAGDLAFRQNLTDEPGTIIRENRNWVVQGGAPSEERGPRARATVGYAPPSFADQAELLSTGSPQAAIQGTAGVPYLSVSGYRSLQDNGAGAISTFSVKQEVTAGAVELGRNPGRGFLRGVVLHVEDPGSDYSAAGTGRLVGMLGRLSVGPALAVLVEAAHAESSTVSALPTEDVKGNAWRVALSGNSGMSNYMLNVRATDDTFVNPLNRGMTAGGVAGQWSIDGNFTQMFTNGAGSFTLTGRHAVMPVCPAEDAPDVSDDMGMLSLTVGSGRPASLTLGSTVSRQSAEAYTTLMLPETNRYLIDVNATLSESFGRLTFSQTGAWQNVRDKINPMLDTKTYTATATGNGSVGTFFTLSAMASGTRSQADPLLGATDTLMLTAQPIIQVPRAMLSLSGNLMYTKTKNATQFLDTSMEQYGGIASWNPARRHWAAALQASLDWTRTRDAYTTDPRFVRRIGLALTVAWSFSHGETGPTAILPPPAAMPAPVASPGPATPGHIAMLLSRLRATAVPWRDAHTFP
jgi:hypothetical protein